MTATTRSFDPTVLDDTLCIALELGEGRWKIGFARGFGGKVLRRQVVARDGNGLLAAIVWAKAKLALSGAARVVSLYEAGRDGFWLHRFLVAHGIDNLVIDSSSLEVNRGRSASSWEASASASRMRNGAASPEGRSHSEDDSSATSRRSSPRIRCSVGTGSSSLRNTTGARGAVPADLGSPARSRH